MPEWQSHFYIKVSNVMSVNVWVVDIFGNLQIGYSEVIYNSAEDGIAQQTQRVVRSDIYPIEDGIFQQAHSKKCSSTFYNMW